VVEHSTIAAMSTWRQLAIELFPERRRWFQDREATCYWAFFDLLPLAVVAHTEGDSDTLNRIYRFAEWCFKQRHRAPDVWNAAATAFYEHLVDKDVTLEAIPCWVKPEIFEDMSFEFERRLERKRQGSFQELVAQYRAVHQDYCG
jgi:hypothetical protein